MAYTTDAAGNYFIGEYEIPVGSTYPHSIYNSSTDSATFKADLDALKTILGWQHLSYLGDWTAGTPSGLAIKFADDPIATDVQRYSLNTSQANLYRDDGVGLRGSNAAADFYANRGMSIIATPNHLQLIFNTITTGTPTYTIVSMGTAVERNPSNPYATWGSSQLILGLSSNTSFSMGYHLFGGTESGTFNLALTNGRAIPAIACTDGQTAGTTLWCTNYHVLHDVDNGFGQTGIRIGQYPNTVLSQVTGVGDGEVYTLNTTFDSGENTWLVLSYLVGQNTTDQRKALVRVKLVS